MAYNDLRSPSLAPQHRELVANGLKEGVGVIPGETPSRRVKLIDDFGENYPVALGCMPGSSKKLVEFRNKVTATNIPTKYNRSEILAESQQFEDPYHANLIRVD